MEEWSNPSKLSSAGSFAESSQGYTLELQFSNCIPGSSESSLKTYQRFLHEKLSNDIQKFPPKWFGHHCQFSLKTVKQRETCQVCSRAGSQFMQGNMKPSRLNQHFRWTNNAPWARTISKVQKQATLDLPICNGLSDAWKMTAVVMYYRTVIVIPYLWGIGSQCHCGYLKPQILVSLLPKGTLGYEFSQECWQELDQKWRHNPIYLSAQK